MLSYPSPAIVKRRFGLRKCLYHGEDEFERWVGWGIIAYDLQVIGIALAARCLNCKSSRFVRRCASQVHFAPETILARGRLGTVGGEVCGSVCSQVEAMRLG